MMNYVDDALWVAQGLLALAFVGAGSMKLFVSREKLIPKMRFFASWSPASIKLLGTAELLGGIGMVAPGAVHVMPILTPVAALCLAVLMGGAIKTHLDLGERPVPPAVLGAFALLIAIGRLVLAPLS
jgi:DoxX-like family